MIAVFHGFLHTTVADVVCTCYTAIVYKKGKCIGVLIMIKKLSYILLVCVVCAVLLAGCKKTTPESPEAPASDTTLTDTPLQIEPTVGAPPADATEPSTLIIGKIILASTTSAEDSGLLAFILPEFTAETGWDVEVVSVGDDTALQMGRDGEADVLLLHSRQDEDKFVEDGYAARRYDVMRNDFVVVGPDDGSIAYNNDIKKTLKAINDEGLGFVAMESGSGTHKKEMSIWNSIDIDPEGNALYLSIGQGMGATLRITKELNIYTLSDRATWLSFSEKGNLSIICEGDPELDNPYGLIPVSASVNEHVNAEGGQAFADWITSTEGKEYITKFGAGEYDQPLFIPAD